MAASGASLLLHEADAELLGSRRAHMRSRGYQTLRFEYLDDPAALANQDALIMENLSGELVADRALQGGERISLGGDVTLEVVHTPGHSPGSASFVLDGPNWAFTGDGVQIAGGGGIPLYVDPVEYGASQKRLLEDVRPNRLYMGHRFRRPDGTANDSIIDGPRNVERALRDSLAVHERMAAAAALVKDVDLANPRAEALAPAAQALGLPSDDPSAWPAPFFTTLHGHLARAAARA
jgi:glyoxylase-like metal-dependent hydrolase (beta-lactamase superfamily II)